MISRKSSFSHVSINLSLVEIIYRIVTRKKKLILFQKKMANYNDTKEQLEKTEERLVNAEAVLNQFKEGENDGELLKRLRIKAISGELSEGGKGREGEIRRRGE